MYFYFLYSIDIKDRSQSHMLEVYCNFLNNEKEVGLNLPNHYMISINLYIPSNDNFLYKMVENFAIDFIIFIHHFKSKLKIIFIQKRCGTIIFFFSSNIGIFFSHS